MDLVMLGQTVAHKESPSDDKLIQKIHDVMDSDVPDEWKWEALEYIDTIQVNRIGGCSSPVIYALSDAYTELLDL